MITNYPGGVSSFGIPVMGGGGIPAMMGEVFFVDYRNGSDGHDGKTKESAFKTVTKAYNSCVSNRNDVILIDGDSTVQEATMLTWSKNRIHVVGLGGGFRTGQRAKIQLSTAGNLLAVAGTITLTGVGNTFSNLKVMNSGTHASSVTCLLDSGEANVFQNCSFMKFTDLDQTTVSDVELRSDSTTYIDCELGFDTLTQSVARPTLRIINSGATRCKHLQMIRCRFTCQSSDANKQHILVGGTSALAFDNYFEDCVFSMAIMSSTSAVALTNAVASASGLVEGSLLFARPISMATNFCAGVTDQVYVVAPAVSNNAITAVTPA